MLANDYDPDGDVLTAELVTGPTHGALAAFRTDGSFEYTPEAGFVGEDSLTYRATDGLLASMPVSVLIRVTQVEASVSEVRPIDSDFAQDRKGRVLFSTPHDDAYHLRVKTTGGDKYAQVEDGKITITAYLDPPVAGVWVYFEVLDPDDPARPSMKNPNQPSRWEDQNPATTFSSAAPKKNIEGPVQDDFANDNRDPDKRMDGSMELYNRMQANCLSARKVKSQVVRYTVNGQPKDFGFAEVVLSITDRYAGDNYIVRATTVDPAGKPFNNDSNMNNLGWDADIPANKIQQSAILTAWKRVYYEEDWTYRAGSLMRDVVAGSKTVEVFDATPFQVGTSVRILDGKNREGLYKVDDIQGKVLTLDQALKNGYTSEQMAFVGIETGQPAQDYYRPDTSKVHETFDDTFTEVVKLASGSEPAPPLAPRQKADIQLYVGTWFSHRDEAKPWKGGKGNYFYLVSAGRNVYSYKDVQEITDASDNSSVVFTILGQNALEAPALRDIRHFRE